ncbi:MAG: RNA-binding protein [Proteobacteria bacterium]|nr:RNA-binding protein [Pseudomonadota bacterium]
MNPTVYLSNLSYKRDRNGLIRLMAGYGKVKHIHIIMEPTTGQSRGMAFIEMSSVAEAKKAIEGLNGLQVDGRLLKANYATSTKPTFVSKALEAKKLEKDVQYKEVQLMKKARNLERRNRRPF